MKEVRHGSQNPKPTMLVIAVVSALWISKAISLSVPRYAGFTRSRWLASRRFVQTEGTLSDGNVPDLPLVLFSPNKYYNKRLAEKLNMLSRSRVAEIQWNRDRRHSEKLDTFSVCESPKSLLTSNQTRRIAWMAEVCPYKDIDFIAPRLKTPDTFLWITPDESSNHDYNMFVLESYLRDHLSPAGIRNHNHRQFAKWLDGHHYWFRDEFNRFAGTPAALKFNQIASVSEWLAKKGYGNDRFKMYVDVLQSLAPLPVWSMPPVPPDGQELPLILQDIDGCIKRLYSKVQPEHNPSIVKQLNEWSRSRTAEVRWMTYWGVRAATEFAPSVGLDTFEHGRDVYVEDPYKEEQVLRWIDRNPKRKIVWIDDEIRRYLHSFGFREPGNHALVHRMVENPNLLMVQPNGEKGVTDVEIPLVNEFLSGTMTGDAVLEQNRRVLQSEDNY